MEFSHKAQRAGKKAARGINFLVLPFCFTLPHFLTVSTLEQVGLIQICSDFLKDLLLKKHHNIYRQVSYQGEPI